MHLISVDLFYSYNLDCYIATKSSAQKQMQLLIECLKLCYWSFWIRIADYMASLNPLPHQSKAYEVNKDRGRSLFLKW